MMLWSANHANHASQHPPPSTEQRGAPSISAVAARQHMLLWHAKHADQKTVVEGSLRAPSSNTGQLQAQEPSAVTTEHRAREHMMMWRASRPECALEVGAPQPHAGAGEHLNAPELKSAPRAEPVEGLRTRQQWARHLERLEREVVRQQEIFKTKAAQLRCLMQRKAKTVWGFG